MTEDYFPNHDYDPEDISAASAPAGYRPMVSHSAYGALSGPIFERTMGQDWCRGFRVMAKHTNAGGFCHGGMLMTFADIVAARSVMTVADPPFVTVRLNSDFIQAAKLGDWVVGETKVVKKTRSMVFVEGELTVSGTVILSISGIFKLLGRHKRP